MGVTGVGVVEAVGVIVTVGVSVGAIAASAGWRIAKYTKVAPMAINRASNPKATGKFNVITGIRFPRLIWAGLEELLKSLPQTRQREASSLTRVPQVGQSFVGFEGVSRLINYLLLDRSTLNWPRLGDYTRKIPTSLTSEWYTHLNATNQCLYSYTILQPSLCILRFQYLRRHIESYPVVYPGIMHRNQCYGSICQPAFTGTHGFFWRRHTLFGTHRLARKGYREPGR